MYLRNGKMKEEDESQQAMPRQRCESQKDKNQLTQTICETVELPGENQIAPADRNHKLQSDEPIQFSTVVVSNKVEKDNQLLRPFIFLNRIDGLETLKDSNTNKNPKKNCSKPSKNRVQRLDEPTVADQPKTYCCHLCGKEFRFLCRLKVCVLLFMRYYYKLLIFRLLLYLILLLFEGTHASSYKQTNTSVHRM